MNKELRAALVWGALLIPLALGMRLAREAGLVDADTVTRIVIGLNGLMIAWYGNRMPKAFVPSTCARKGTRVAGWSTVLSGLAYAGLFAFAPLPVAFTGGCAAVVAGIAVTLVYCLSLRAKGRSAA
jgi:hypothetical protein